MWYSEFIRALEHEKVSSLYWIYGVEEYLKQEAVEKITKKYLGHNPSELERKLIYADKETIANTILEEVMNLALFVEKKVVVVKAFDQIAKEERNKIIEGVKKTSNGSCLILVSTDSYKDKDSSLNAVLEKYARSCRCTPFYDDKKLANWIIEKASSFGKQITDEAIELLIEKAGKNLFMISNELKKLAIYVSSKPIIEAKDVEEISGELAIHTVFDLCDAIGFKDQEKALKLLQELIKEDEPVKILAMIVRHFRIMWQAKLLQKRGMSSMELCNKLRIRQSLADKFLKQVEITNIQEFPDIFERFLKTNLELKRWPDPKLALELLTVDLCNFSKR